jgi:hypothetical protein
MNPCHDGTYLKCWEKWRPLLTFDFNHINSSLNLLDNSEDIVVPRLLPPLASLGNCHFATPHWRPSACDSLFPNVGHDVYLPSRSTVVNSRSVMVPYGSRCMLSEGPVVTGYRAVESPQHSQWHVRPSGFFRIALRSFFENPEVFDNRWLISEQLFILLPYQYIGSWTSGYRAHLMTFQRVYCCRKTWIWFGMSLLSKQVNR